MLTYFPPQYTVPPARSLIVAAPAMRVDNNTTAWIQIAENNTFQHIFIYVLVWENGRPAKAFYTYKAVFVLYHIVCNKYTARILLNVSLPAMLLY